MLRRSFVAMKLSTGDLHQIRSMLTPLRTMLTTLVEATPSSFATCYSSSVVAPQNTTDALLNGASATFTFIRFGHKWFAIGAAHCSFYYGPEIRRKCSFVQLPLEVLSCDVVNGESGGGLKDVCCEVCSVPSRTMEPPAPSGTLARSVGVRVLIGSSVDTQIRP